MISQELLDKTFDMLVAAAVLGERCPQSKPHGMIDKNAPSTRTRRVF